MNERPRNVPKRTVKPKAAERRFSKTRCPLNRGKALSFYDHSQTHPGHLCPYSCQSCHNLPAITLPTTEESHLEIIFAQPGPFLTWAAEIRIFLTKTHISEASTFFLRRNLIKQIV